MSDIAAQSMLNELAERVGISPDYHDIWGQRHSISEDTKRAILAAMGIATETPEQLRAALAARLDAPWRSACDPVLVTTVDKQIDERPTWSFRMPALAAEEREIQILWEVWDEAGRPCQNGHAGPGLSPVEVRELNGRRYVRFELPVPSELDHGYYDLKACGMSRGEVAESTLRLILAPPRCYVPPRFEDSGQDISSGIWGFATQLYGLRSGRNWGVGDFGDLGTLQEWAAQDLGADIIGVNPLHALRNTWPYHVSPYSPESRLYLNVLYLDVERIAEYKDSQAAQDIVADPGFRYRLEGLRKSELVNYEEVWSAKRKVLEALFRTFRERHVAGNLHLHHKTDRGQAFIHFITEEGKNLERFALFQVLSEELRRDRPTLWMWQDWPQGYRDPNSPEVEAFRRKHVERVLFHQYLQWVASEQLREVAERGRTLGMAVGLYRDFALGSDRGGSDAWLFQDVLALQADCGAPPDAFAPEGQNWGLPPINPERLRDAAYRPFIELLRKNVQYGGGLRLDHVMALFRLFWIPRGLPPSAGAYVQYPAEDLLNILALESARHQVVVVGEDLGTVPDRVRERLARSRILSYRVFYFERRDNGDCKRSGEYPRQAVAVVTTHDLPTLAGYWRAEDIHLRHRLGFYRDPATYEQALLERQADKARILAALRSEGLWKGREDLAAVPEMTAELCRIIHLYLARTPSWIVLVALEDVIGEREQANLPGTVDTHPNWCRKLSVSLDDLRKDSRSREIAAALGTLRSSNSPAPLDRTTESRPAPL